MNGRRILAAAALAGILAGGLPFGGHARNQAEAAGPVRGGTVIDGLYEEPDRLIPNTGATAFDIMVDEALFSPLFYSDDKGNLHLGLASEVPTQQNGDISKDGLTYTFKLKPGLKWSDGQPLDARDVDYSWRLWTNKDLIINSATGFDHIKSADVSSDNLSITFHLSSPYAPFVAVWVDQVMPVPAHILSKFTAKQLNTSTFTAKPTVGSGPFMLTSRTSGVSITTVRNPNYYQAGKPYLNGIIFKIIPDQVAITNALRAHEIDNAWFLDVSQIDTYKSINGYTFLPASAPNIEQGVLNLKNPILQDVRVRQALEYGLDRDTMIKQVWKGTALPMASDVAPTSFAYDPSIKPYPFDPVKAGKLLDEAGWKLGSDGRRHKNGKTLTLRWSTTSRNQWRAQDEVIALTDYQNIGIDLRIVNYPGGTFFGQTFPSGDFDIGEWENGLVFDPVITIASYFGSGAVPPHGNNWGRYVNPAYDKLIASVQSTTDATTRKSIFSRMQQVMNTEVPSLWLYDPPVPSVYRNTLHNYKPGPYSYETWNTWEWWKG